MNLQFQATSVTFLGDWTYVSEYRNGECRNHGTWYATAEGVHAHSRRNPCDMREGANPEAVGATILPDGSLFLNLERYVPDTVPLTRGTIWRLVGFEEVDIRVEYEMHIRRKRPTAFEIEVHNRSGESLTLQRIALSTEFVRTYREGGFVLPAPSEIAAQGLSGIALAPGESYRGRLEVRFDDPGERDVYFNILVMGSRQPFDTRRLYTLEVHE